MQKRLFGLALLWCTVYVVCQFYEDALSAKLWIMAGLVWLPLWGVGLTLLIAAVVFLCRGKTVRVRVQSTVSATLIALCFYLNFTVGPTWARDVRFALARPGYEGQVRAVLTSPQARQAAKSSNDVRVDRKGDVVRVAFVQPGGILDNWTAIVYDPTGAVEKINGAKDWDDWHSSRFDDVRELFGGDMVSARSLGGGWYRCTFT